MSRVIAVGPRAKRAVIAAKSGQGAGRAVIAAGLRGRKGNTGSGAGWGGIVGTLADQLDLLAALNGKATSAQGAKADTAVQPGALATVATSGSYTDLSGKPALGTAAATAATDYATAAQGVLAAAAIPSSEKGAALGVATLDAGGKVPAGQLPSYVDDVLEFADFASLPATGEAAKIYITLDDSKSWRWGGTAYAEISASPGSTDDVPEGASNFYHTAARVLSTVLAGLSLADSTVVTAADSLLQAIGKLAARLATAFDRTNHTGEQAIGTVTGLQTALDGKATIAQGALADTAVQPATLTSGLAGKVDVDGVKVLSDENYTSAEKSKLAGLESSRFKGLYASLGALQTAHPTAGAGDYADVDAGIGSDTVRYVWDVDDAQWILSGSGAPLTAAQVKTLYESNADTNAFTDSEKTKLGTVASNATANPDTDSLAESGTPTNQWFTEARVRATLLTGLSLATSTAVAATDTLLAAIGKLAARLALKEQTLTAGPNVTIDRTDPDNPIISASITGGGGGDVVGPADAIANEVALFDGITGKLLKGGGALGTAAATAATDYATAAQGVLADGAIQATEKGAALGVATLDAAGLVPAGQLPSYVDDVLEFADLASLPGTGETGKIYVTLDDSRQFRWSGSAYVQLVASPGTTDNVPEGSTNLYHTAARVRATLLTDLSLADATVIAAPDSVLQALGKLAARLATAFDRANHTGSQATSTIAGLDAALAAKAAIAGLPSRTVTASGAITPADAGLWLISTSATPITLTIGAEATAAWTSSGILPMFHVLQIGAGAVTVTGDGFSVTRHADDTSVLAGAGAAATALWRATNTWSLIGRLVAA